jgi:hypothetical protein
MAESNSRRKTSPKVASVTPKPDKKAPAPLYASNIGADASPEEIRQLIAEAAYFRAMERGFEPGHELEDWIQAEAEVMGRLNAGGR